MLLICSYSTCGISKQWVLKYDTNSYANLGTICNNLGNTLRRNILKYHAITGCDTTLFFYRIRKISTFKEVLKLLSCLSLIECLGKNKSLSNTDIEKCMTLTQTVLYGGNINEAFVNKPNIYDNQKTISSMTLPPDPDCATQVIVRVHSQCYYYVHCLQEIIH